MSTLSVYPVSASAFITEADAQSVCMAGTVTAQRDADAIVRGINWGASMIAAITGRNLKDKAYTIVKSAINADSRSGTLKPNDSAATAVLSAAMVGEPLVSAHLPNHTVITRAWNGTSVGISTTGLGTLVGSVADSVIIGSSRMLLASPDKSSLSLTEWPLSQVSGIFLLYDDGSRDSVDFAAGSILDYDNGIITLGPDAFSPVSGSFGRWIDGDDYQPRVEVECRCGYVAPSVAEVGHPAEYELLAQVNRDLCVMAWQRFQTPGWGMQSVGAGSLSATFDKSGVPSSIRAQLEPFMRMGR